MLFYTFGSEAKYIVFASQSIFITPQAKFVRKNEQKSLFFKEKYIFRIIFRAASPSKSHL